MKMNKKKNNKQLAIIGGGASGMVAAIFAFNEAKKNRLGLDITLFESNARIGKKILVTGNGRCNFSNENISSDNYHGDVDIAYPLYQKFDNSDTVAFFKSIGVMSKADAAGRLYPMSFQASSVLDALRAEIDKCGINVLCDTKINSLRPLSEGYLLNDRYYADCCIIACGAKAAPVHGSDGSGYDLIKPYNVSISPVLPALSALVCENFPKGLKGIRAHGRITVKVSGRIISEDTGEIQYTDYGLSGIPSMQVSGAVSVALNDKSLPVFAFVDACPYLNADEIRTHLIDFISHNPEIPAENLLSGILPKKLGITFLQDCSISPTKKVGILHYSVIEKLISVIKCKKYRISSVRSFNDAQVCCGGINFSEVNPHTLELKKAKRLFVCGEILNIYGDCGGYNLQWAWSSGYVAGINSVRELK